MADPKKGASKAAKKGKSARPATTSTIAQISSTTSGAPHSTTAAPHSTTTAQHTTTAAPHSTTTAPHTTTAAPHSTTTAQHTTTAAPHSTTTAHHTTTAAPHSTTTAQHTTTAAPHSTTTAQHTTTAAPHSTTTAQHTTTAAPHSTTTAQHTTTAAPKSSTTAPAGGTTKAPGGSTTAHAGGSTTTAAAGGPPSFAAGSVTIKIDPDDGAAQNPNSYQVSSDAVLTLNWTASNASKVSIDPLGDQAASGSAGIPNKAATYTLIASSDSGAKSDPFVVEVSNHPPGSVVSAHTKVASGIAKILSTSAMSNGAAVTSVTEGAAFSIEVVCSDSTDTLTVNGDSVDLATAADGSKTGSYAVAKAAASQTSFECKASAGGAAGDDQTINVAVIPSSTTARASTTTHAGTTTAHAASSTTHAGTTTAHAASSTTHAGTTTAHAASSTTHAGTTTAHPGSTTTHVGTTTTHPGSTTTHPSSTTTVGAATGAGSGAGTHHDATGAGSGAGTHHDATGAGSGAGTHHDATAAGSGAGTHHDATAAGSGAGTHHDATAAGSGAGTHHDATAAGSGAGTHHDATAAGSGAGTHHDATAAGSGAGTHHDATAAGSGAGTHHDATGAGSGAGTHHDATGAGSGAGTHHDATGGGSGSGDKPKVVEFTASFTTDQSADPVALTSLTGKYADDTYKAQRVNPTQRYSMYLKTLSFSWKVEGYQHALVDLVPIWQQNFVPKTAAKGTKRVDAITQATKDANGDVKNYDWTGLGGVRPMAALFADLRLIDPTDKKTVLDSRTILAYTDSPVGGVTITAKADPGGNGASLHWVVSGVGSAPVYAVATDGGGKQIGDVLALRARGDTHSSGDAQVPFSPAAYAGQSLHFQAVVFGQPDQTGGKTNPDPFNIAGEGVTIASQTTSLAIAGEAPAPKGGTAPSGGGGDGTADGSDGLPKVEFDKIKDEKANWKTSVEGPHLEVELYKSPTPIDLSGYFTMTLELNFIAETAIASYEKDKEAEANTKVGLILSKDKLGVELAKGGFETGNPVIDSIEASFSPFEYASEDDGKKKEIEVIKGKVEMKVLGFKVWNAVAVDITLAIDLSLLKIGFHNGKTTAGVAVVTGTAEAAAATHFGLARFMPNATQKDLDDMKAGTGWFFSVTGKLEFTAELTPTDKFWDWLADEIEAVIESGSLSVVLVPVMAILAEIVFVWELYKMWQDQQIWVHCQQIVDVNADWVSEGFAEKLADYSSGKAPDIFTDGEGVLAWAGDKEKFKKRGEDLAGEYTKKAHEHHKASAAITSWKAKNSSASDADVDAKVETDIKASIAAAIEDLKKQARNAAWPFLRDELFLSYEVGKTTIASGGGQADGMYATLYPGYQYSYNPGNVAVFNKGMQSSWKWRGWVETSGDSVTFPPRMTEPEAKALLAAILAWVENEKKGPMPRTPPAESTPEAIAKAESDAAADKKAKQEAYAPIHAQYERIRAWVEAKDGNGLMMGMQTKAADYFAANPSDTPKVVPDTGLADSLSSIDYLEAQRIKQAENPLGDDSADGTGS